MNAERTDRQLLECFTGQRGELAEQAFTALVERHGPMVLGVCRNLLGDSHSAEDAFQATFLVLVRKADALGQPESLGPWLHGVALRTARKAKSLGDQQRRRERQEAAMGGEEPVGDWGRQELRLVRREEAEVLHEEVARLPEQYRAPVVLCYLEGLTHVEAATRLRWPVGTLSVRLMRARKLLHARLSRRGLAPSSTLLALAALSESATAALPSTLAKATATAAVQSASGQALSTELVSSQVADLIEEVLGDLFAKTLILSLGAIAAAVVIFATCASAWAGPAPRSIPPLAESTPKPSVNSAPRRTDSPSTPANSVASNVVKTKSIEDKTNKVQEHEDDGIHVDVSPAEHLKEYRERAAQAGPSADAQVRLALWCETQGLSAERFKHLALAILTEPSHVVARGLLGQISRGGRWRRAEEVAHDVTVDSQGAADLAEYNARRENMSNTADAHWNLALWCERHGLKGEAMAHLIAVTRLAPGRETAWKRLGYQRFRGRWMTEDRIAAERAEFEAQRKADRRWGTQLAKWRDSLGNPKNRADAELALAGVSDPRAANAILAVFGNGKARDQARAVQLLGQLDSRLATRALALFAVGGSTSEVQRAACETLARRDHHEALGLLVGMLRDPEPNPQSVIYRFQMFPIGALGPASPGVTYIEGRKANILRFYTVDESIPSIFTSQAGLNYAAELARINVNVFTSPDFRQRVDSQNFRQLAQLEAELRNLINEANFEAATVRASVRRTNAQVIKTLKNISGMDRDGNWESWKKWWVEERGYAYEPEFFHNPPDTTIDQPKPILVQNLHLSCFAAGTPVRTLSGLRPIESIRVGDQVLSQDTTTGALSFEPVVAALKNPPDATVRVELENDALVATGIHRFWKASRGWVMARDLKPGDLVRLVGGVARVQRVTPLPSRPVFNLEVANHPSYFVGRQGVLVHDNSPVDPVVHPFDGVGESLEKTIR